MLRGISLGGAAISAGIGLVFPFLLARHATALNQTILLAMMAGVAGAFIYGVGFRMENRWLELFTRPVFTWPLLVAGAVGLVLLR